MQDMKDLVEAGMITDSFFESLRDDKEIAEANNKMDSFLKEKSGHFSGNKKKRNRNNNRDYA